MWGAPSRHSSDIATTCDVLGDLGRPRYHLCIDMQTNEIVLATRGNAGVEDALTDVVIQSVRPPFLVDQVYDCIVQTASTRCEQILLKLNDLHMETGRKIVVVGHSLGGGVAGPHHYQALWRATQASERFESVSDVPLLELRRSSLLRITGEDALLGAPHDLLAYPPRRRGTPLLRREHRENVLALKQVDEMEILPSERLTRISFADQGLGRHLPDHVDLMPERDERYVTLRIIRTLLLLHPGEDCATTARQVPSLRNDSLLRHRSGQVSDERVQEGLTEPCRRRPAQRVPRPPSPPKNG